MTDWTATPLEMDFRLGEFRLATVVLRGVSMLGQQANGAPADEGPLPPDGALAGETDAALVDRCQWTSR